MTPRDVRIRDDRLLYFPRLGWLRLCRRGNPYPDAEPVQATLKRVNGKWMAVDCYAVAAMERPDDGTVTGVDMNIGQVAVSDGRHARIVHAPDPRRLEAKIRRRQRRLARQRRGSRRRERTQRRIAMRRRNWQHNGSRGLARGPRHLVVAQFEIDPRSTDWSRWSGRATGRPSARTCPDTSAS